jgi:hypothetical protein
MGIDSAHGLLDMARGLLFRADAATAGVWPRASALLARQALQSSVLELWQRRKLGLQGCSMRAQLICLRTYLGDVELASRVGHCWSALSRACHHHPYELAPTASELHDWFGVVEKLILKVRQSELTHPAAPRRASGTRRARGAKHPFP